MIKNLFHNLRTPILFLSLPLLGIANAFSLSLSLPNQGLEEGEYGYVHISGVPQNKELQLVFLDDKKKTIWRHQVGSAASGSSAIPFVVPKAGEYEVQLRSGDKWLVRLHLLVENERLWVGESLHEAVLNMLGILRTEKWFGSPATNLPSDDPKFVAWVMAKEQTLLQSVSAASSKKGVK